MEECLVKEIGLKRRKIKAPGIKVVNKLQYY